MADHPTAVVSVLADDRPLGAGGVKALEAERQARRAAERELRELRGKLLELAR